MSYIEIVRGKWGGSTVPKDVLRLNKGSLALAENISETFQSGRTTLEGGTERVILGLAVDPETKRIKLITGAVNGFNWSTRKEVNILRLNLPSAFKKLEVTIGDYALVPGSELEFALAE